MNEEENKENSKLPEKENVGNRAIDAIRKRQAKNNAFKGKMATVMGPIIMWATIIILIVIMIIGIAMFFITMPGMVMDKLKQIAKTIVKEWLNWENGTDSTKMIEENTIYESLNYLEEMGYDLKGFGFLTDYIAGTEDGVKRDGEQKIIEAKSDFITTYLASDNYVYTIKNNNLVTSSKWQEFWQNIGAMFGGAFSERLTRGLIAVYYEGGALGERGSLYPHSKDLKLNVSTQKLTLKRGSDNSMSYSLEGWTGRYGMPIDFLMSVHLATMMPDLAYDMANNFDTEIILLLHDVNQASVIAAYKIGNQYITYSDLDKASNENGWSWLTPGNFDIDEAKAAMEKFGITIDDPSKFGNETDTEDQKIEKFMQELLDNLKVADDKSYYYYYPYIESVENHWYRNVYYAINNKNTKNINGPVGIVRYDYDYESVTKERWTLYKTYTQDENAEKAGEYKLYALNAEGNYATSTDEIENYEGNEALFQKEGDYYLFTGSAETQKSVLQGKNDAGIRFSVAKMPELLTQDDEAELIDLGWTNESGIWTAYGKKGKESEKYVRLYPDSDDPIKSKLWTKITSAQSVKQTGEGQRGPTNEKIKNMFLNNTYFRYDSTTQLAEIITALRNKIKKDEITSSGDVYGPLNHLVKEIKDDKKYYIDVTEKEYLASELGFKTEEGEEERTYRVSDYSGKVTINQDSLNAFSMLENTHTLDSDYIYRDFKELIVELRIF